MGPGAVETLNHTIAMSYSNCSTPDSARRHGWILLTSISGPSPYHQPDNTIQCSSRYLIPPFPSTTPTAHPASQTSPFSTSTIAPGGMEPQTHTTLAGPTQNPLFPKLVPSSPDKPLLFTCHRTLSFLTSRAVAETNAILQPHPLIGCHGLRAGGGGVWVGVDEAALL